MPRFRRFKTYLQRSASFNNASAKRLLGIMEKKRSNLCVSIDVTNSQQLLDIAQRSGPYVCLIKTHVDIVADFSPDFTRKLLELAEKYDFLIFEDRKFADIGNTVHLQYTSGPFAISSWSHITNAHIIPGEGIISGLKKGGLEERPKDDPRGLLLLAEMSSSGAMTTGNYTEKCVELAKIHSDFVIGFISMKRLIEQDDKLDFIHMTPGVGLDTQGDSLGQQYRTPEQVIRDSLSDIIIVGRGIYGSGRDIEIEAKRYRDAGWKAYEESLTEV